MKTSTKLQDVASRYNCTLNRACTEILCAAGIEKRRYPAVIRKQRIPAALVEKAKSYRARKIRQAIAELEPPPVQPRRNPTNKLP